MHSDREFLEQLNQANPIIEVAKDLDITVPSSGTMSCLFPEEHGRGDKVPSMRFDKKRNTVHCFGCRKVRGWKPLDLVRHVLKCSRREAIAWLANRAGISVPTRSVSTPSYDKKNPNAGQHYPVLTEFVKESEKNLGAGGLQYFGSRGISEGIVRRLHLGYVNDYDAVMTSVAAKCPQYSLKDAGLTSLYTYGQQGAAFVTIPYIGSVPKSLLGTNNQEMTARCVFLKARYVGKPPPGMPKYVATASAIPFPYNAAILDIEDEVFVTEGEIDALTLMSHGYPAVGIPGASIFKIEWAAAFVGKVVNLVFDADRAGRQGARDISRMLAGVAKRIRRVDLPHGMDVNEFFMIGEKNDY